MKRRIAELPLHGGKAPSWLFARMARLAGAITMAAVDAWGPRAMLQRLADPWWFQAFGCVLGFDWHSSGLTTVTCGALKEAQRLFGDDLGIQVAGGKGGTSRRTPQEIEATGQRLAISSAADLVFASRMSAKVDSAAVQDGYQVYHHSFFYTVDGAWCVVQQGMNQATRLARRYHWLSDTLTDFVCEPHEAIHDAPRAPCALALLNMVAAEAGSHRDACTAVTRDDPDRVLDHVQRITEGPTLFAPQRHPVRLEDVNVEHLRRVVRAAHERDPRDFITLLGTPGLGPAAVRSLSLVAELIYEVPPSRRDPVSAAGGQRRWADYSYAHGGKDGTPFPVDRETYDRTIAALTDVVRRARVGDREKTEALRRLAGRGS